MSPELKNRIAQLIAIRRKVDKATKRADAQQTECSLLWKAYSCSHFPSDPDFASGLDKLKAQTLLTSDTGAYYRGEYSYIFPDSIGPTVKTPYRWSFPGDTQGNPYLADKVAA